MSVDPVFAALAGLLLLHQVPVPHEIAVIAIVIVSNGFATVRPSTRPTATPAAAL